MRLFSFTFLISAGAALGHTYLYWRLLRQLVTGRAGRAVVIAVLAGFTGLLLMRNRLRHVLSPDWSEAFVAATYTWMAIGISFILATAATDGVRTVLHLHRRLRAPVARTEQERTPDTLPDEARRDLIVRTLPRMALAGGAVTAGYGAWRAFDGHRITEVEVRLPGLPKTLDGFSIVQLSDVHVGPFIERRYVEELVRRANALKPDLVAITGDLVDGSVARLGPSVAALAGLQSRHGTHFVTGNHDYYSGDVEWTAFLDRLGIHVLRNRHVSIGDEGGRFDLVGVDDWSGGKRRGRPGYDLDRALAGRDLDRAAVLLAHQPANFRVAAERGIGLQISGHTHGGQVFPGTHLIGLQWEYVAGLYRHADSHIFVSRGCGFWGPPIRLGSPPEIVKLVLTA